MPPGPRVDELSNSLVHFLGYLVPAHTFSAYCAVHFDKILIAFFGEVEFST